jgi:hypothetical protein
MHAELVALVRQLRRKRPKGGQRSLREISAVLAARGHLNERGQPFSAARQLHVSRVEAQPPIKPLITIREAKGYRAARAEQQAVFSL